MKPHSVVKIFTVTVNRITVNQISKMIIPKIIFKGSYITTIRNVFQST